jgi:UDP-N-acetylglucosamine 2-epimerase
MKNVPATYVITLPNSDVGSAVIREQLSALSADPRVIVRAQLGALFHFGLMRCADAMLGNSSSAIIEAPIFALPAVNIGDRQRGRLRGDNVLEAPAEPAAITTALQRALDPSWRRSLSGQSPYGDGRSAPRIAEVLAGQMPHTCRKQFANLD